MQKHEKLKTIYEVMAPHIVRNEHNWQDYLTYASNFFKVYPFDNVLLAYGQNPNATILATFDDWKKAKRDIIKDSKGIAVCEYENAKLTVKTLFDVSQTRGPELQKTNWQLDSYIRQALTDRLAYAHGLNVAGFNMTLRALAAEAVTENYQTYFHGLSDEISGHLFENVPKVGLETQITDLLTDSVTWFISKRCGLLDDEITIGDGMVTVSHFNTLPLITRLGHAVTLISRGILLEAERTIKIVNKERVENNERTITMSASPFSCPWDSGQVGWIYADRQMIEKEYGALTPETFAQAEKLLLSEVECYDYYLTGQCYGFQLYEGDVETDSCWGFLGDFRDLKEDVKSYLPEECKGLVDKLEHQYETPDIEDIMAEWEDELEGEPDGEI